MKKKIVYCGMSADIIHEGHINIIEIAASYGEVTIGLLTDKAITSYKRLPYLSYIQRKKIIENIKGVERVVEQDTLDYVSNLEKVKPDFLIHADDWKEGIQRPIRDRALEALKQWDGKLIEPEYTKGISSTKLNNALKEIGTTPQIRMNRFNRLLNAKPLLRVLEAHSGLSGMIVENAKIEDREFDAIWLSSLTDSTVKGKPDIECVDFTSRLNTLNDILEVTTKPIIYDGDSGGDSEKFIFMVRTLERLGVSAVIIEDKIGLKRNSLLAENNQEQDSIQNFSNKIAVGKKNQVTDKFMIIARVESLILGKSIQNAIQRAKAYSQAGADAILIHSKSENAEDILVFAEEYVKYISKPLVVVPTTYNYITESELKKHGINVVIYANQLLRASYPRMCEVAESILTHQRAKEVDKYCMSTKEIVELI